MPIRTAMQNGPIRVRRVRYLDAALRELAGCIRAQHGSQCATRVALTVWGQDEDRCRAPAAGLDVHRVVKPARREPLQRLLDGLQQWPAAG